MHTPYPQKLALSSSKSGGRSVGIFHLRTKTMEFSFNSNSEYIKQDFELLTCYAEATEFAVN
jgi:hypothetical protein